MLANGESVEKVNMYTDLSIEKIRELKKEI